MRVQEPTSEQVSIWKDWVATRPPVVRAIAERIDPWTLYRMRKTGKRVTLRSISENGTVSVNVTGQFYAVMFGRSVFGVNPDDLEPCDLPGEG